MCFSTAKYARLHVQVMSTKWKTILKSSLKSIFQGEVIVGNHFNLGFQCYSDVTKKKLNDLGPQCVEFCHNFIIKKPTWLRWVNIFVRVGKILEGLPS